MYRKCFRYSIPILEISLLARKVGALVVVDGLQGAVHTPIDVQLYGCDFYVFKSQVLWTSGVGALWGKMELLEEMDSFIVGGGMVKEVSQQGTTWADIHSVLKQAHPNCRNSGVWYSSRVYDAHWYEQH